MRPRSENFLKLVLILQLTLQLIDFCLGFFELENLVKLINQLVEGTYEAEKTFRNQYTSIVLSFLSPLANIVTYVVHNMLQGFSSALTLLGNDY